jgi:DNA-binding transcriptional ArsR family regulator
MATKRPHRDLRYRDKCFPGAAAEVFNPKSAGFAPLPYLARELLRHLKDSEMRVWVYMLTRAGEYQICYPTYEDLMAGTGVSSKGTISKAIHALEKIGLIRVYNDRGTRRYLLRDPRLAVEKLFELGRISEDELEDANDLQEKIGHPLIEPKKKLRVVPMPGTKTAAGKK